MAIGAGAMEGLAVSGLPNPAFWAGKRVLLTGHTGFKGAWANLWLTHMGAKVFGFALAPITNPSLYDSIGAADPDKEIIADIREGEALAEAVRRSNPDILLHMAAQPLVRRSYAEPVETFDVNVMGTVRVLEAVRQASALKVALAITTDKVYRNDESGRHFCEEDRLGGHDPYSASKAACELAVSTYREAFLSPLGVKVATARGGNVLGGGDFSEDRLVPDIVRAALAGHPLEIRSPMATRPWQHVLDCLSGYFQYIEALHEGRTAIESLNFGPPVDEPLLPVRDVAGAMQLAMGLANQWQDSSGLPQPKEMQSLGLNPARAATALNWRSHLCQTKTIEWTARWYDAWRRGSDARELTLNQINAFMKGH